MKTVALFALLALSGCGGLVVFEADDGPSDGGGGSSSSVTPPPPSTTGPQPTGCVTHSECGDGKLCIFQTGTCADACEAGTCDSCTAGTVCNDCATSACRDCRDCRGACVPKNDSQCDEDDPCGAGFVCLFDQGLCAPACAAKGLCSDPGLECQGCVSGSCCGCDDCVSACIGFR